MLDEPFTPRPDRRREIVLSEIREVERFTARTNGAVVLDDERQSDRMLAGIAAVRCAFGRCDVGWKPLIDVDRLRVEGQVEFHVE